MQLCKWIQMKLLHSFHSILLIRLLVLSLCTEFTSSEHAGIKISD